MLRRTLDGFSKCAMVAAHYAMSDVLDNLVISLTKVKVLSLSCRRTEIRKKETTVNVIIDLILYFFTFSLLLYSFYM